MGTALKGNKAGLGEEVSAVFLKCYIGANLECTLFLAFCSAVESPAHTHSCCSSVLYHEAFIRDELPQVCVMFSGFFNCELNKCFLSSLLAMENSILIPF